MTIYNFAAGPATLPDPVIKQIQAELPSINDSGMSIMEISHRSALFDDIINAAEQDVRDLMHVPNNYHVLFFQGGGTGQFAAVPMNLATTHKRIALLDSGHWATRAGDEATNLGYQVDVLDSTKDQHYQALPQYDKPISASDYDYLHITTNNTIEGTAYHTIPEHGDVTLVGDLSSNFMAEEYNVADFGLIFGGVQKNLGPAGVTLVIVRDDLVKPVEHIPSILNYSLFVKKNSMFNTPPVFNIYATGLVLKWLKEQGGIAGIQKVNQQKASLLYDFLDDSKLFANHIKKSDRSLTNIPFTTGDADLDKQAVTSATEAGLMNLKGHRSVGGLRASLYNAMPLAGVQALVDFLHNFEKQH
ncbi:3-phosphoserine/phosphohydroxythreonine transaminase [Lentilactobacillus otakiensis]|uniref:Phosphoserine aminotransferase n=1 Tax=Lentilactobacillus otakiensis DSM 19908 = JCM 15040 TaxID=1423780 RepID=S4NQ47_9LACO|nr:3-phosphoserine/phosphohydroxythreonine transaminase [Lentilactobacillus otakiensis]KRL10440.1 phosphoserine aminotransferase [Lentilactobacillus otakiensis DSM 19908 = JCM 15040]MBZ3777108.1 3-phosphoserine/phosphohydroxythreonine transaminase [Lentilactobacillus otakiensis]MDV3518132.1 3-phosphoserine/phosphohydroxythreonine transaminase [Lentilactobacillus otakiensis]GAD16133.1 phosphoserine aminotransferase [Lentilactobacillus otakiensis DSM 19908 = JCM 15040]